MVCWFGVRFGGLGKPLPQTSYQHKPPKGKQKENTPRRSTFHTLVLSLGFTLFQFAALWAQALGLRIPTFFGG